jgi:hypothetical protein
MDSHYKPRNNQPSPASQFISRWSEPLVKGFMFGVGHYITYKIIGPQLRKFFQKAIKPN